MLVRKGLPKWNPNWLPNSQENYDTQVHVVGGDDKLVNNVCSPEDSPAKVCIGS
jgi:hypothetical protein